jgi:GNAT superfamily N-acetyltransferase
VRRAIPEHDEKEQAMNGKQIYIRVATGHDRERLRGMFARSSPETLYRRFHIPYPEVPEWVVDLMLGTDRLDNEVLVAVAEEKIVGHAMYVRLGNDTEAEMAITVEDRWQSMGVGKSLLLELAQRARLRDIETFTGEVLGQNRSMLALAAMFLGTDYATEHGVCRVRMPLQASESAAVSHTVRRAA